MEQKFIVITGEPVNGFSFTGPFDSHDEAVDYAETTGGDWWIGDVNPPEQES